VVVVHDRHLIFQPPFAIAYRASLHSYVRHCAVLRM
jgi:hypothetical protein